MKQSRGQLTVFIILGIVLLLSISLVIYFNQQQARAPLEQTITVPEDVRQIYDAVSTCTNELSREGLETLGIQGGYINLPPIIARTPTAYLPSDSFAMFKTPFWYYEGEDRTPTLDFMTRELAVYVRDNLADCVDNFSAFEPVFTITPLEPPLPVVTVTDERVIVNVNWPLDIETADRRTQMTDFVTSHTIKLKAAHELASKIMQAENRQEWFENLTLDLMSTNERIPMSGMELSCGAKKWYLPEVRKELQTMLAYNLPTVRVANTPNPPPVASERTYTRLKDQASTIKNQLEAGANPNWPTNVPPDVYEINRMTFNAGVPKTDLKVAFSHQTDWQFLLTARPARGAILSTENMKGPRKYLRFVCLNQWQFAYDAIYPVKTMIRDDTAFNGEGFIFQMAFPVLISNNEPSRVFFGIRKFQAPPLAVDFCTNFGTRSVDVRANGFIEGSPIAEELEDANITYRCLNQECILGKTYSDGSGAIRLTSYLPEGCNAPLIVAQKEGYLPAQEQIVEGRADLMLTKLKKFNISLQIIPYYEEADRADPTIARSSRWLEAQSYTRLTKNMHATISLSLRGEEFDQYLSYPANATQFSTTDAGLLTDTSDIAKDELSFVFGDARYDLDIMLFKGDLPVGGYHAENMTISYEDLAAGDTVMLPVIEYRPLPEAPYQQAAMFLFLQDRGKYEEQPYQKNFKPSFI